MTDMAVDVEAARLLAWVSATLPSISDLVDTSWPNGVSRVLRIDTPIGRYYVKQHRTLAKYETERDAYTHEIRNLSRTPDLVACNDELQALILTAVEGESVDPDSLAPAEWESVLYSAGTLLKTIHDSRRERMSDWHDQASQRLDKWLRRAPDGLFQQRDILILESALDRASRHTEVLGVFAHWDWQPRNWMLVDGAVHAFDFEHARTDTWLADVQRLYWHGLREKPRWLSTFLSGYGGEMGDKDMDLLAAVSAISLASGAVWAYERGDVEYCDANRRFIQDLREL